MNQDARRILIRFAIVVGWTSALYAIYQVTNRYHLFTPTLLPVTPLDAAIPFWTWTVVPYFALIGGMYLPALIRDEWLFKRSLVALTVAVLINYTIFALWPTIIARPLLPEGVAFYDAWYRWLTTIDTPANCFPSGHITAPVIGCWALAQENPRWRWAIRLALIPFLLTILTTKQHYVWDLFGGLATAVIGILLSRHLLTRSAPPATGPSAAA